MVLVWPKNDAMRKLLKHPVVPPFRETGPMEWPDDSFTFRRIQDGDVVTTDPGPDPSRPAKQPEPPEPEEPQHIEAATGEAAGKTT